MRNIINILTKFCAGLVILIALGVMLREHQFDVWKFNTICWALVFFFTKEMY
jgi:hypothetical protein